VQSSTLRASVRMLGISLRARVEEYDKEKKDVSVRKKEVA